MLGLSFVVGWNLTLALCVRDGLNRKTMEACYIWAAASAVVCARLLYIVTNLDRLDGIGDVFKFWEGGLVAYGGFIGGFVGSVIYCRVRGVPLLAWADCAVPSLCTGLMITRIGCFLHGCDFGRPWSGGWAVHFPANSPAWLQQRSAHLIGASATESLAVHPTQLYESLNGLILLVLCLVVRRYRTFSGQVFVAFTMGYAVLRYLVEGLRGDEERGTIGPLSTSQFIGVTTFLAGAACLAWLYSRYRRDPESMRLWRRATAPAGPPARKRKRR
jgi:phosphatidylglycerol:prolipoprotein diacylglycerol transferase